MHQEILVHVRAPARVADDKKYLSIAQGIFDFQPVKKTLVTRCGPEDVGTSTRADLSSLVEHVPDPLNTQSEIHNDRLSLSSVAETPHEARILSAQNASGTSLNAELTRDGGHNENGLCRAGTMLSELESDKRMDHKAMMPMQKTDKQNRKRKLADVFSSYSDDFIVDDSDTKRSVPLSKGKWVGWRKCSSQVKPASPNGRIYDSEGGPLQVERYYSILSKTGLSLSQSFAVSNLEQRSTPQDDSNPTPAVSSDAVVSQISTSNASAAPRFIEIQALPLVISGPSPSIKQLLMSACENAALRTIAQGLSLPRRFRPEKMTRAVLSDERGYWSCPIILRDRDLATSTTSTSVEREVDPEHLKWRPLLKQSTLTEDDFLDVWAELSRFILGGNAGRNVTAIRRGFSIFRNKKANEAMAQLHVDVYCYGEAIPYIYAVLLVCTRMHAAQKPLQWISTLDEQAVITMSEDGTGKARLGPWTAHSAREGHTLWRCQ